MDNASVRIFTSAAVLSVLATTVSAGPMLGTAELKALYSDNVMSRVTNRGGNYVGTYAADGTVSGVVDEKHRDTGPWWAESNKVCLQWAKWRDGEARCSGVEHIKGTNYRVYTPERLVDVAAKHGH